MKKFLPFILVLVISLYSYNAKAQAKKNVFFEHFTNASCPPCASQNPVFKANILDHNKGRIHHIAYHTVWPGTDPMNKYNASQVASRVSYYGVQGVPDMVMQGNKFEGGPAGVTQDMVNNVSSESSPIRVKVKETSDGTNRNVKVTVYTLGTPPTGNLKLRVDVIESEINYTSAPGTNGEKDFPDVFRKMLPNTNGDTYIPAVIGDSVVFNYSYVLDTAKWDTTKIYSIAFIQNETTKEVINSGSSVDPEWELTTIDKTFLQSSAGDTTHFTAKIINTGNKDGNFRINLDAEQPSDWSASFTYNSIVYNDSVDIVLPANASVTVNIDVKVGSTLAVGNYLFSMKSLDGTSFASQILQYNVISSGITDLVVNNQGAWTGGQPSDFEDDYLNALEYAGDTAYAATSYQLFMKGMKANQLTNVKCIYFNVDWTFPSLTDENVAVFSDFLDNGGSLFIAGQDIGWETWNTQYPYGTTATKAFYTNYLNAAWTDDGTSANDSIIANNSDAVYTSVNSSELLSIYGTGTMYPDVITTKNNGIAIFYYDNAKTKISAIRATNGTYKVVYFGFSPSMISDTVVRKQVIKLTNDWFHNKINGIEFEQAMSKLNLKQNYPNPCNDYTIIPINNISKNSKIQIFDATGRIVLNKKINNQSKQLQINTSVLKNGMYFYRLISNNKTIEVKSMQVMH